MDDFEGLSHTKWECKYHIVFIPKYRRKVLCGQLKKHLGEIFHKLEMQKESRIEQGYVMTDHVHRMSAIPPKYAVLQMGATSKARARFSWREAKGNGSGSLLGSTSGHEDTSCLRWGETKL